MSGGKGEGEGDDGKANARREGERKLNGYILISFVHPQKLPSGAAPLPALIVLRLVSFRERSGVVLHANVREIIIRVPKSVVLIRRGT